ncbi:hypothetical protein RSAG8_09650, partial [Rhizoctonia solani AG-8 WAC10335]
MYEFLTFTEPGKFVLNVDPRSGEHPKKLVVLFTYYTCDMIETDEGYCPQLVHFQGQIPRPPRLVRFATRLGLTKGNKPHIDDAVAKAYMFVSRNYAPGDQVTFVAIESFHEIDTDPSMVAAITLAKHLHNGTRPDGLSKVQSGNAGDVPARRIPIHSVVVTVWDEIETFFVWNDELRSKFPPGIGHLVCCASVSKGSSSCSTTYESDGSVVSREICISPDTHWYDWRLVSCFCCFSH